MNNLNDALAWGLAPLYLAAHGASVNQIAVVAAAYPCVWGAGQLATGWLSDYTGRKPLITGSMLVQAVALALLVAGGGSFAPSLVAAVLLGVGTAMVYPTLIAAVSDASQSPLRQVARACTRATLGQHNPPRTTETPRPPVLLKPAWFQDNRTQPNLYQPSLNPKVAGSIPARPIHVRLVLTNPHGYARSTCN